MSNWQMAAFPVFPTRKSIRLWNPKKGDEMSSYLDKAGLTYFWGKLKTYLNTYFASKENLTDGSVTKVGTGNVGGSSTPVYLSSGTPTAGNEYVPKSGGTFTGTVVVKSPTNSDNNHIAVGAAAATGSNYIDLYDSGYYVRLWPNSLSANRNQRLPDKAGTIAMTSDITSAVNGLDLTTVAGNTVSAIGAMNATSGTATLTSTAAAANAAWFPLGTITFTTAGRYILDVLIDFNDASVSSTGLRALRLKRNGSSTVNPIDMDSRPAHAHGNMRNHCRVVALVAATAGYTVDVECWQNNGAVLTTRCYYSWMRVG